ncbi:hypothetical protein [Rhizobium sp. G21]|uniref:hypothetical protein n=1 Tax=Rhizobium sp. G21 TaxID=2758439 RepID=UPI0015FFF871|nr:hypothetical protein [Rhizobium sp. G21]MBB1250789.1 hypothetical protein [Rhizobium sp. G21]
MNPKPVAQSPRDAAPQIDPLTGKAIPIAPSGELSDREIEDGAKGKEDAARIDPDSRIPRPPQPDLA